MWLSQITGLSDFAEIGTGLEISDFPQLWWEFDEWTISLSVMHSGFPMHKNSSWTQGYLVFCIVRQNTAELWIFSVKRREGLGRVRTCCSSRVTCRLSQKILSQNSDRTDNRPESSQTLVDYSLNHCGQWNRRRTVLELPSTNRTVINYLVSSRNSSEQEIWSSFHPRLYTTG
jgi:hypothetical protein